MKNASDEELNERFKKVRPDLILALGAMCGHENEAQVDDFVQEAMMKGVQHLDSFKGKTFEEFRAWCVKIAIRVALDYFRSSRAKKLTVLDPAKIAELREAMTANGGPELSADASIVADAIGKLETPCRELLTLHLLQGLDYADIAAQTGKDYDTVRVAIARCRHVLKKLFEKQKVYGTSGKRL